MSVNKTCTGEKKVNEKLPSCTHALIKRYLSSNSFSRIFTLSFQPINEELRSSPVNQDHAKAGLREFSRAFLTTAVGQWA